MAPAHLRRKQQQPDVARGRWLVFLTVVATALVTVSSVSSAPALPTRPATMQTRCKCFQMGAWKGAGGAQASLVQCFIPLRAALGLLLAQVQHLSSLIERQHTATNSAELAGGAGGEWHQIINKAEENMQEHLPHWFGQQQATKALVGLPAPAVGERVGLRAELPGGARPSCAMCLRTAVTRPVARAGGARQSDSSSTITLPQQPHTETAQAAEQAKLLPRQSAASGGLKATKDTCNIQLHTE